MEPICTSHKEKPWMEGQNVTGANTHLQTVCVREIRDLLTTNRGTLSP